MTHRLQWSDLPAAVRDEVARECGSTVVEAVGQAGGYGPGVAARCLLANGRRVFVKGASAAQNPDTPAMMRREAHVFAALPPATPAPALLHVLDVGPWVVLVFEDVDGRLPTTPWHEAELVRVLEAASVIARLRPVRKLPSVGEQFGAMFTGWRALADEPDAVEDAWCRAHLDDLVTLESRWAHAASGDHLVHGDLRSDNILVDAAGDVTFVDWTSACVGASWFDVACMLPSVELEGGGPPESVLALAGLGGLDPATLLPVVVAIVGYFTNGGRLPDPPELPTLRAFQRAQGSVTLAWLRRLWPEVPGTG